MAKFQSGQSGNPNGRPKGSLDRRSVLRNMLEAHQPALLEKAVQKALDGHTDMLRLLLDRLLPAKPKDMPMDIFINLDGKPLNDQAQMVINSFSKGKISPLEAKTILDMLESKAKLIEISQLNERLKKLEQKVNIE